MHERMSRSAILLRWFLILSIPIVSIVVTTTPAESYYSTYSANSYGGSYNGYEVFLSPAYHSGTAGARGECQFETERYMARETARYATYKQAAGHTLTERGYNTFIGWSSPTINKNDSNSLGVDLHIPIHSNAREENCYNYTLSNHGTHVIYVSSSGSSLASELMTRIGTYTGSYGDPSTGTNDLTCHVSSNCTAYSCLTELCDTSAVAAYVEAEYHTWNSGVTWLTRLDWQSRIGYGVDRYLGYP